VKPSAGERLHEAVIDVRDWTPGSDVAARTALRRFLPEFVILFSTAGRIISTLNVPDHLGELARARGRHVAEFLHPQDLPLLLGAAAQAVAHPGAEQVVTVRFRRDGGGFTVTEAAAVDARADTDLGGVVVRARAHPDLDDTGVRSTRASGVEAHHIGQGGASRFVSLAEALPLGILSADGFGTVIYVNGAAQEVLRCEASELLGSGWERAVHPDDRAALVDAVALVLDTGSRQQVQFRLAVDEDIWISALLVALGDPVRPTGWLATIDDVTDHRRAQMQLAHQATHDPLTRLPNRVLLEDRLRHAGSRLARDPGHGLVAALFVDLDDFKLINDTHGHATGDEVLAELGRRLADTVRATDTVARFGGDEFVAVCESIPASEIDDLVERIRSAVRRPIELAHLTLVVDATIGVATTDVALEDMTLLLRQADTEMYRHKRRR
jgi:diguanylate cyclase (GGDEF)-like protein/PAS domain S-box-containing protein